MKLIKKILVILLLGHLYPSNAAQLAPWQVDSWQRFHPVIAKHGMVASQDSLASAAGLAILKQGGNAIDAAVAVGFALAVTLPRAGNLGGGGFMLIWLNKLHKAIAIDYREVAPLLAKPNLFLDEHGNIDQQRLKHSYLSAGVPGTVAGLDLALKQYGTLSLKQVMQPAINLAKQGFTVNPAFASAIAASENELKQSATSRYIFFKSGSSLYQPGDHFTQTDLAQTLQLIADHGAVSFYQGEIAKKIINAMQLHRGIISAADLAHYKPVIREPVSGNFHGYKIISMPPPSSGGITLIEILNILEAYPLDTLGLNSAQTIHLMTEAINLAYNDRNHYLADPSFVKIPLQQLVSKEYAATLRKHIQYQLHTPLQQITSIHFKEPESHETTHFSVVDQQGNMVSNTYTLNDAFGAAYTIPGTGILLNDEMTDFAIKIGEEKTSGIQTDINLIAPGKRPLSSMTPTIVLNSQGQAFLATGSPGGSQIITTVMQVLVNVLVHHLNIASAIAMPRFHSQLTPEMIIYEQGFSEDTLKRLRGMGHQVHQVATIGSVESVAIQGNYRLGAVDPRRPNSAALGY